MTATSAAPGRRALRRPEWRDVGLAWVAARVLVAVAFGLAWWWASRRGGAWPVALDQGLFAWDGAFYRAIAAGGYDSVGADGLRFYPLYPLAGRALASVSGWSVDAWLLIVGNLAAAGFGVVVWRLARHDLGDRGMARRAVTLTTLFPSAFVLVWAYAESLYLLAAAGAFLGARRGRWGWVVLAAAAAGALRPVGILLVPAIAVEALRRWRHAGGWSRLGSVAATCAPALGAGAYLLWLRVAHGDISDPFRVQDQLRGGVVDPLTRLGRGVADLAGAERFGDGLHLPFAVAFIVLLVVVFRRLPASYGVYAALVLLVALSAANWNSLERYALDAFPLPMALAAVARPPRWDRVAVGLCAAGFTALATLAWLSVYVP